MYDQYFGERLGKLRQQKGVSARDMSLSIGQSEGYINAIENRKSLPSMTAFFYICEYLGITPGEFFDGENTDPSLLQEVANDLKSLDYRALQLTRDLLRELRK